MNKWQIVYAQWGSWASHDVIKHHIITTDVIIKIAIKATGNPGLSHAISRLSIGLYGG